MEHSKITNVNSEGVRDLVWLGIESATVLVKSGARVGGL